MIDKELAYLHLEIDGKTVSYSRPDGEEVSTYEDFYAAVEGAAFVSSRHAGKAVDVVVTKTGVVEATVTLPATASMTAAERQRGEALSGPVAFSYGTGTAVLATA